MSLESGHCKSCHAKPEVVPIGRAKWTKMCKVFSLHNTAKQLALLQSDCADRFA